MLSKALKKFDRLTARIYANAYNPFYQSGIFALGLLLIVIVTGVYLLFFYKLSNPYESMLAIQAQSWGGKWIRTLHRYASDLAVVFTVFHFIRMLIQKRVFGPRILAWISGVALAAMLLLCGWTGFILVWDRQGQAIAEFGAKLIDQIPWISGAMGRAFSGSQAIGQSFFFMNLFLHVAIPLGMTLFVWIHTSRLARAEWLPARKILVAMVALLGAVSIVHPVPLSSKADFGALWGIFEFDLFFSGWILFGSKGIIGTVLVFLVAGLLPWILKKPADYSVNKGPAQHDEVKCEGCEQCVKDCPFEAISMVPRTQGKGSEFVANVNPDHCVSCGICAGSCDQFAIGPVGRSGLDQLKQLEVIKGKAKRLIYVCQEYPEIDKMGGSDCQIERLSCIGQLHAGTLSRALHQYQDIDIFSCAGELCQSREGVVALLERIQGLREPTLPPKADKQRLKITVGLPSPHFILGIAGSLVLAAMTVKGSFLRVGQPVQHGALRLSLRITGQVIEVCKNLDAPASAPLAAQIAAMPKHMQKQKWCDVAPATYFIQLKSGSESLFESELIPKGIRADRPLILERDFDLQPGVYDISLLLTPKPLPAGQDGQMRAINLEYKDRVEMIKGRTVVIMYDPVTAKLKRL